MRVDPGRNRGWSLFRRRREGGQGLVEFMLVAPVFFFAVFAMMDGGLLLYSINALDQSTTIGSNSIAGLGPASNGVRLVFTFQASAPINFFNVQASQYETMCFAPYESGG